jgi:hypothetical protein
LKEGKGTYQGKKWNGYWDVVIPDHLAFLDSGQIGACSVADGCGTYKTASAGGVTLSSAVRKASMKAFSSAKSRLRTVASSDSKTLCSCDGSTSGGDMTAKTSMLSEGEAIARALWKTTTFDNDRRQYLQAAVSSAHLNGYILTYNDTHAIFGKYESKSDTYKTYQIAYISTTDNAVTLVGEPVEVAFETVAVERVQKDGKTSMSTTLASKVDKAKIKADEEDKVDGGSDEADENADGTKKKSKKMKANKTSTTNQLSGKKSMATTADTNEDVVDAINEAGIEDLSGLEKALSGTAIGKMLSSALHVADASRTKAVKAILSTTGGKNFTAEILAPTPFDVLDKMASSFMLADANTKALMAAEESEVDEELTDEELLAEDAGGSPGVNKGLALGYQNYEADAEAAIERQRRLDQIKARKLMGQVPQPTVPNYAGRVARAAVPRGVPEPADIFAFDANNNLVKS